MQVFVTQVLQISLSSDAWKHRRDELISNEYPTWFQLAGRNHSNSALLLLLDAGYTPSEAECDFGALSLSFSSCESEAEATSLASFLPPNTMEKIPIPPRSRSFGATDAMLPHFLALGMKPAKEFLNSLLDQNDGTSLTMVLEWSAKTGTPLESDLLHEAVRHNSTDAAAVLLMRGWDPNAVDSNGLVRLCSIAFFCFSVFFIFIFLYFYLYLFEFF